MAQAHQIRAETPPPTSSGTSNGGGGGRDIYERLSRIEAHVEHMATKAWVLGGVVGGMGLAAVITLGIIKIFTVG